MKDEALETDYLVVGAGAAGMAFTDALIMHTDATVTIVDRRHAPGGHWIDVYPYVRLHQPSAFYGVDSMPLGQDRLDAIGTNAGYHELAGADEIRAYFAQVMQGHFLPSGRVRYFPCSDYLGDSRFVSRLAHTAHTVRVRRKLIDTTYLEGDIPATHAPPFEVAEGVRCLPAGEIVHLREPAERFTVIGAGKAALDACVWLLERGVPAAAIRWIKPREAWCLNRRFQQPGTLLRDTYRGLAIQLEAMAQAGSIADCFARFESAGLFLRVDSGTRPSMFRGAVVSEAELALLRTIKDVVRLGHVRRIEREQIVLDEGCVPTSAQTVHVHCASRGLVRRPLRPIFEPGRVIVQPFMWTYACYQFTMLGVAEATVASDDDKNRLCPSIANVETDRNYLSAFLAGLANQRARAAYPRLANWAKTSRLNPFGGIERFRDDPGVIDANERIKHFGAAAAGNLAMLLRAGYAPQRPSCVPRSNEVDMRQKPFEAAGLQRLFAQLGTAPDQFDPPNIRTHLHKASSGSGVSICRCPRRVSVWMPSFRC